MCGDTDPSMYDERLAEAAAAVRAIPQPPTHIVVSGDEFAALQSIRPATDADGRYLVVSGEPRPAFPEMAATAGYDLWVDGKHVVRRRPSLLQRLRDMVAAIRWSW